MHILFFSVQRACPPRPNALPLYQNRTPLSLDSLIITFNLTGTVHSIHDNALIVLCCRLLFTHLLPYFIFFTKVKAFLPFPLARTFCSTNLRVYMIDKSTLGATRLNRVIAWMHYVRIVYTLRLILTVLIDPRDCDAMQTAVPFGEEFGKKIGTTPPPTGYYVHSDNQ